MKKTYLILLGLLMFVNVFSQEIDLTKAKNEILNEAKMLYKLELASWHSTDLLYKESKDLLEQIEGYCSFIDEENVFSIFWDKKMNIIFYVQFDSIPSPENAKTNTEKRKANKLETDLIEMRINAFDALIKNENDFFKFYENTNPNLIPIIDDNQRTVFILTASTRSDLFVIGNDYKLSFDDSNKLISKVRLHNSLIVLNSDGEETESGQKVGSIHTHVIEDFPFMTSTDICTFLLYKDIFKLNNHVVVSEKYMSIFHADTETFIILPKNMFNKE